MTRAELTRLSTGGAKAPLQPTPEMRASTRSFYGVDSGTSATLACCARTGLPPAKRAAPRKSAKLAERIGGDRLMKPPVRRLAERPDLALDLVEHCA